MSAIPGFGTSVAEDVTLGAAVEVHIPAKAEWRIEIPFRNIMKVTITEGVCEVFGTELPLNVQIPFSGVKYALYAPLREGCKLTYTVSVNRENVGLASENSEISEYLSEDTTMDQILNLHLLLEYFRQETTNTNASNPQANKHGPKVLIVGSSLSGKTSLAKILCSYAFKMDRTPILVNLNPRDGVFSMPGTLTATPISDKFDLESAGGWGGTTTSGTLFHNPKQPLVKNYGFQTMQESLDLYKHQVSKLGVAAISRMESDPLVRDSGLIIDTPGLTFKDSSVIESIVSDFEVDVVVVIGNEKLLVDLRKRFKHKVSNSLLNIVKIGQSGGVTEVDESFIRMIQEDTIRQYFNGNAKNPLSPFKTEVDYNDYVLYKGIEGQEMSSNLAFLPAGDSYTAEEWENTEAKKDVSLLDQFYKRLEGENIDVSNLENAIVAITQVPQNSKSPKEILNTCVLGYAHISKVDAEKGRMKVLLPFPGPFPRNVLMVSTRIGYAE